MKLGLRTTTLCLFSLLSLLSVSAQNPGTGEAASGPAVSRVRFLGKTKPLRDLQPVFFNLGRDEENEDEELKEILNDFRYRESERPGALPQGEDPARQFSLRGITDTVEPISIIEGMGATGVVPPDPTGDIGGEHYIQMINGAGGALYQMYDKAGNKTGKVSSLNVVWKQFNVTGLGDPIALYDQAARRWVLTEFADRGTNNNINKLLVAISATEDPQGSWMAYEFDTPLFPDYPKFFIWNNAYLVTTNEYGSSQPIYALEREAMLAGRDAQMLTFGLPRLNIGFQLAMGADWDGDIPPPPGSPVYIMRVNDDSWGTNSADRLQIYKLNIDWATPAQSKITGPDNLPVAPFKSAVCTSFNRCIPQPNGQKIAAIDRILTHRINYRNFGTHESIVCAHICDVNNKRLSGIRWYELRKTDTSDWKVFQQGTFSPDTIHRFFPSIAIDADGNIGLGYSVAGYNKFPSLRFTGRRATDPPGEMTIAEYEFATGQTNSSTERWGDYSHMTVDPVDGRTFWYTGEYMPRSGAWATKIATFVLHKDSNDIGPRTMLSPVSGTLLGASDTIRITLKNYGYEPQSNFTVSYQVAGGTPVTETVADTLAPGAVYTHTFRQQADLSAYADYPFRFFTSLPVDQNLKNDTLNALVSHRPALDAAVSSVADLSDVNCADSLAVRVILQNTGFDTIRTVTVKYRLNADSFQTVAFNGLLTTTQPREIGLVLRNFIHGTNTFTVLTENPNNRNDDRPSNDTLVTTFQFDTSLVSTTLVVFTNSAPTETTWALKDAQGNVIQSGGPYANGSRSFTHKLCLRAGECYTFSLFDKAGNGIVGGTYNMVDDENNKKKVISLINSSFGSVENNYFCLRACTLQATAAVKDATAAGTADGSILLSLNGGAGPFTYTVNGKSQSTPLFNGLVPGTYEAIVQDANGCADTLRLILGPSTATRDLDDQVSVKVFPNPNNGKFEIVVQGISQPERLNVSIFDALGQQVATDYLYRFGETLNGMFSLTRYPKGLYFIRIYEARFEKLVKVVIE